MPFQFMCPQGHLLEGQESQMGQQVQCPLCGTLLIIPVVGPPAGVAAPPEYSPPPAHWPPQPPTPGFAPPAFQPPAAEYFPPAESFPAVQTLPSMTEPTPEPEPVDAEPAPPEEPTTVRILCPNGHELHTPMDMIGMQAACPECNAEFLLRYEDSLEYIEKKKAARALRDEAFNKNALTWSITAAVIVFVALITMMILASTR